MTAYGVVLSCYYDMLYMIWSGDSLVLKPNQSWFIVSWTLGYKLKQILIEMQNRFKLRKYKRELVSKMSDGLFRTLSVKLCVTEPCTYVVVDARHKAFQRDWCLTEGNRYSRQYSLMRTICHFYFVHDDVIKWKHFPRNWPFVRGIHRSRWIPHTKASDAELWCFLWSASE